MERGKKEKRTCFSWRVITVKWLVNRVASVPKNFRILWMECEKSGKEGRKEKRNMRRGCLQSFTSHIHINKKGNISWGDLIRRYGDGGWIFHPNFVSGIDRTKEGVVGKLNTWARS